MADGDRYRMVTIQDGIEHVSSVIVNHDEAQELLDIEQDLHESTGWKVISMNNTLFCERLRGQTKIRRQIQARSYTPLDDHQSPNLGAPLRQS